MSQTVLVLVGAMYGTYGLWALVQLRTDPQVPAVLMGVLSLVGGIGLLSGFRWSKYFIYIVSTVFTATWLYYVVRYAQSWAYGTVLESVISLLPGLIYIAFAAGSCYLVTKHFHVRSN